jgi:hypothetical protein
MTELFLSKPYARSAQVDVRDSGVRAYRDSPETVHLQIRIKGKKIGRIVSVSLTFDEAVRLADHLIGEAHRNAA